MQSRTIAALVALMLLATCFAANNHTRSDGSFRIQLQQREVAAKFSSECFAGQDGLKFPGNQTVYRLLTGGDQRGSVEENGGRLACRHALSPKKHFMGTLQIGTPPQQFEVLFDTGSDVLWVTNSTCRLNGHLWSASKAGKFAIDRSTSFKPIGRERASMIYGNLMRFSGQWVKDVVQLADTDDPSRSLTVSNQTLALVCTIEGPQDPYEPAFDGLVGLGFSVTEPSKATLLENLQARGVLHEPVFSFYTNQAAESMPGLSTGELIFGQIDKSRYKGSITWTPVVRLPHWEIRAHSIRMPEDNSPRSGPKSPHAIACAHGCTVILDTGTDFIYGPDIEVARLNEQHLGFIRNQFTPNLWFKMGACRQYISSLPLSLVIQMGDTHLELKPEAFLLDNETTKGHQICMSALRSFGQGPEGPPVDWLLGSIFIQNFYTIFDYGNKRVGFATPV